jgi:isopentenyldiphosphate isomerase
MALEIVTLVNLSDEVIGEAPRSEMRDKGLLHRVTYIFVFNSKQELLLQKRTEVKDFCPGYFDVAAGGVVTAGESYEVSAERELEEELGLKGVPLEFRFDHYFEDDHNRCWGRVFSCQSEGPFKLQASEVQEAKFVSLQQVLNGEFEPITPDTFTALKRLVEIL